MGPFRLERWARNVVIIKFVPPEVKKKKQTNEQKTNLTDDPEANGSPWIKIRPNTTKYMNRVQKPWNVNFQDTGHQATKNSDLWEKGVKKDELWGNPSLLHVEIFQAREQLVRLRETQQTKRVDEIKLCVQGGKENTVLRAE